MSKDTRNIAALIADGGIETLYRRLTQKQSTKWVEEAAGYLIDNIGLLESISESERKEGYRVKTHDGNRKNKYPDDTEAEKHVENDLFLMSKNGKCFQALGRFIDYETPLGTSGNNTIGDIDLLAYNDETKTLTVVELKRRTSRELLLRAVIEVYTYSKRVKYERFISDFADYPTSKPLSKAVLVFKDERQHNDYNNQPKVRKLMKELGVELFVMSGDSAENYVIEPVRI
jgi:Holliday junction resolvase-like predicted endonuclease